MDPTTQAKLGFQGSNGSVPPQWWVIIKAHHVRAPVQMSQGFKPKMIFAVFPLWLLHLSLPVFVILYSYFYINKLQKYSNIITTKSVNKAKTTTTPQPFYGPFPRTTQVSRC